MPSKAETDRSAKKTNGAAGWDKDTTTIAVNRFDKEILDEIGRPQGPPDVSGQPQGIAARAVIHQLVVEHVLHARVAKVVYEGVENAEPIVFQKEVTPEEAKALEEFLKARREGPRAPA